MDTEIIEAIPSTAVPQPAPADIEVTAIHGDEMQAAQSGLIAWCDRKIASLEKDRLELAQARDDAKKRKWKFSTLANHAAMAAKRVLFYQKLKLALEHGYLIVPNFPVQVFAIRRNNGPDRMAWIETKGWVPSQNVPEQNAQLLPASHGNYVNPFPQVIAQRIHDGERSDGAKVPRFEFHATRWDEFEVPVSMAKPQIMDAVDQAMKLRIFDELGILPGIAAKTKKVDPMIVARIIDPRAVGYGPRKRISFLIAWHLDTRTL